MPDHEGERRTAVFRFYGELNDFLPEAKRKERLSYSFRGTPSVKDAIEAQGVPGTLPSLRPGDRWWPS